jgi:ATP phosphoribosyltransferase
MSDTLTIALSKGRIFEQAVPLLAAAGIRALEDPEQSRKLILDTNDPRVKLVIIRASDVPTYVQYGAADLGVAGKDVLLEHGGEGLYEPLDLRIARCRLMVAGARTPSSASAATAAGCASPPSTSTRPSATSPPRASRSRSSSSTAPWNWPPGGPPDLIVDLVESGKHAEGQRPGAAGAHLRHQLAARRQQGRLEDEARAGHGAAGGPACRRGRARGRGHGDQLGPPQPIRPGPPQPIE